jgi:hypothetical protein
MRAEGRAGGGACVSFTLPASQIHAELAGGPR